MIPIGKIVSHYRIIEEIGHGGMGVVYKAEDTKLRRAVALKFLPPELTRDPDAKQRFLHEARAAAALNHANIVTVYEINEHEGQTYISMEYVEGQTLKDIVNGPLPLPQALDIATQTAKGLTVAHAKGIVHRDVKPANIFITNEGGVKILDFGIAKLAGGQTKLTKSGTTLGTVAYMSPEQALGKEVDQRSDIWSLGVILYEMLTGKLPFAGEYDQAMLYAVINEEPEPASNLRGDIPDELQHIVDKALAKDKEERYQHVDELLVDLRNEGKSPGTAKSGKAGRRIAASKPKRKRLPIIAAAAAIAIAAILFLLFSPFKLRIGQREPVQAAVNSLAVMYFENLQDPEDKSRTSQMITALLTTGLSDSPRYLQVMSSQRLYDILKLLGKGDLKFIDKNVASEVARKAGVRWIVTGKILTEKPNIALISEISDVNSGRILATQRVNGATGEDLFAVIDKLSPQVIRALTLPKQAQKELEKPVADLTTHSQDAYRSFIEGVDCFYKVYFPEAEKHFKKTLEYDSTFAMAYYWLARMKSSGNEFQAAKEYISLAQKHSAKLTQKEKLFITGEVEFVAGKYDQSIETLQKIIAQYPEEKEAYLRQGAIFIWRLGRPSEAISPLKTAIAIDPLFKAAYFSLAFAYDETGDLEKSLWAINQYINLAPGEANPYDARGRLYAANGQIDQAIASYKKALEIKPDYIISLFQLGLMYIYKGEYAKAEDCFKELSSTNDPQARAEGRSQLGLIPMYQGRFLRALEVLDDCIAADDLENNHFTETGFKHICKAMVHEEQGRLGLAIHELETGLEIFAKIDPEAWHVYRDYYVLLLSMNGKTAEAAVIMKALKIKSDGNSRVISTYWRAAGAIAWAKDDLKNAQLSFENGTDTFFGIYMLARTCLQENLLDKAAATLEKALSSYNNSRISKPILAVKAYYLLGLIYEKSGWNGKAIEKYKEFLGIWKNADPGLPEVADARLRLQKLEKL